MKKKKFLAWIGGISICKKEYINPIKQDAFKLSNSHVVFKHWPTLPTSLEKEGKKNEI